MATNNPIITASVVDTNDDAIALTGDNKKLIRHFSYAYAEMSATAQNGASLNEDMYIIRNGNNTGYGTSHTFERVESNEFTFSAEDSEGNLGIATVTPTMVPYAEPTCYFSDNKINVNGTTTVECWGAFYNGSFGAVTNTLTVKFRYKVYGGSYSEWYNMSVTINGNNYTATATLTGLDYTKIYFFEAAATDKIDTTYAKNDWVSSKPVFHWGEGDFTFNVPVTFNGYLISNGGGIAFNGNDTVGLIDKTEAGLKIYASQLDLLGDVRINGYSIECGEWTPALSFSAISSYATQKGWYCKTGNSVTVGFYIKANCKSGYSSTAISISGLPFNPAYSAAGGGMCSGAYVSAGFNFQCFVAETSGNITTRVQACNNTSASNLSTSSSGCFYRSGGGELTLSGTITYFTYWN